MIIKSIQLTKSKTVGVLDKYGKTKFKKVQIFADAELEDKDNPEEAYKELSQYIENNFEYEKTIK